MGTSSAKWTSNVAVLNQTRTSASPAATPTDWVQADPLQRTGLSGSLDDTLMRLAIAQDRLACTLRENEGLKSKVEYLMQALDEASRRSVAAQRVAHHDGLTGLPNRLLLIKKLQQAIRNAASRHRQLALLFIDLDGFKLVNDRYGHTVADRLLSAVGARIAAGVRGEDIACRYGGDEFIALLSDLDDAAIAVSVAEKIRNQIGESYSIDGTAIHVSASIGLAVYPKDGGQYQELLNHADAAMFRDKADRRSRIVA
jgi:diguanylate cyclase